MDQVIIYTNDEGNLSVCMPSGELPIEQVLAKDCPASANPIIVDKASLPWSDEDYRNSWEQSGNKVVVNFQKAIEQTKERLRFERKPLLESLDVQFQRALETGADTTSIVAEKQRLRDITQLTDAATTLDELRSIKVE